MNSSPEQKLINITNKVQENLNQTKSSKELIASKDSGFDFAGEYSYEKIKQKYASGGQVDALSQSISSDIQNEEWKQKIEKMKQEFDTEKAVNRIEVEESNNALDIHSILKKYGGSGKDNSWAYEFNDMEKR